ncbi:hypothetical protein AAZX31_04G081000 [Glycine max]
MATSYKTFLVNCSIQKRPSYVSDNSGHYNLPLFLAFKPLKKVLLEVPLQIDEVHKTMANTAAILLDAFVDSFFEFLDQPLLPSQSNFAPVVELGEAIVVTSIQGQIPDDFPEGKAPGTGELVTLGVAATKPFAIIGIISAEGKKLVHKVDLNLNRCTLCHDIGVTPRYNVIMDFPLTIDLNRLLRRGPLIKYNKEEYARIGVMPRYGDANSIKWFEVEPNCTFHMINSFEDGHEVVVRGCRSLDSLIPGPDPSLNEFEWLSRCHEWQLNMQTGEVKERGLCGANIVYMDFPMMNGNFIGIRNRYAYNNQVVDPIASSKQDVPKYGGLAKLYFEESCAKFSMRNKEQPEEPIRVECHMFEKNTFCSGAAFVPRDGVLKNMTDGS